MAMLVTETVERRYRNLLALIGDAMPMVALEMELGDGSVVFTHVQVR